ncbi:MAG: threonine ammonia-lyase, biosynthetic [Pseudomonadota bacterium]
MTTTDYVALIEAAEVYDVAIRSPLDFAERLSDRLGNDIWLKREDLQPVFSFKLRGAYNRIRTLTPAEAERGVICSSAGNHAQGVALAAAKRGIAACIVMPITTPSIKSDAVRRLGGKVVLHGDNYDEAQAHAHRLAEDDGYVFVHPFDDPLVIAGQGTIGREILEQADALPDAVFIPVGGGGLAAGVASWIRAKAPSVQLIGVEPADAASMQAAFAANEPTALPDVGGFADGVAVRQVGHETYRVCRDVLDEIVTVDTDETCAAIQDLFEETRSIVEPAGALAVAAIAKTVAERGWQAKRLVALNCGANMNFDRLRHVVERSAIGKQTEALLAVEIPERPGSFLEFCSAIGRRSVTEFNYRATDSNVAHLFVGIGLAGGNAEKQSLLDELSTAGYVAVDLSDNDLAKLHVRHMIGGIGTARANERLYRFRFPERPGALARFLRAVGSGLNISLFHYRNHGSDYGRVLAGIEVDDAHVAELTEHFDSLGYPYWDETDNAAYRLFLRSGPSMP